MSLLPWRRTKDAIRVSFDEDIFLFQAHGGISRYFINLATYLPEFGIDPQVIAPIYFTHLLKARPDIRRIGRWVGWSSRRLRWGWLFGRLVHAPLALLSGTQVVHQTYYRSYRHAPRRTPIVTTIYDMIFELMPHITDAKSQAARKAAALGRADRVICISHNTKRDLLRFFPEVEKKTSVIHLGVDDVFRSGFSDSSPHEKPYLLHVGMRRDYKNFDGLLAAMAGSAELKSRFDLVCVSSDPFTPAELAMIGAAGLEGSVHLRQAHEDWQLRDWYHHAAVFVYPSLYEGFGIPPLEAMAAGCPVVCMRSSSMPEVCGDAAEYAEPDDDTTLRAAIEKVTLSPGHADALRVRGRERAALFSWRECAKRTSEVYRSLF